jgi:carbon storage regulator CsrA
LEDEKMLIVGREVGQSVIIGECIKVTVHQNGSRFRLAIDAPRNTRITQLKEYPNKRILQKGKKVGDTFQIGEDVKVSMLRSENGQLRFAIDAPKEISVLREEIFSGTLIGSAN